MSIDRPCNLAEGGSEARGRQPLRDAPTSTSRGQAQLPVPSVSTSEESSLLSCPGSEGAAPVGGRQLSLSTHGKWKFAIGEKDSKHSPRRAAIHITATRIPTTTHRTKLQTETMQTSHRLSRPPNPLSQDDASTEGMAPERRRRPNRSFGFSPEIGRSEGKGIQPQCHLQEGDRRRSMVSFIVMVFFVRCIACV
jgi:hypothetical protein